MVTPAGDAARALPDSEPEAVANGLVGRPNGVSVLTTHALYVIELDGADIITTWRTPYDPGSARKPGQLSWGSGTTPTFFGPRASWIAIVDNADDAPILLILSAETGRELSHPRACGETNARVSTLPILTLEDRRIWSMSTDETDQIVSTAAIDADTGEEVFRRVIVEKPLDDPGQMTGLITPDGTYWQATFFRVHVLRHRAPRAFRA